MSVVVNLSVFIGLMVIRVSRRFKSNELAIMHYRNQIAKDAGSGIKRRA